MKRWERWSFNLLAAIVALTGALYLWMKYVLEQDDPFAVVNHPWQAPMLAVHVLASPLFLLVFGIVFNSHIMKKLRASNLPNQRSGLMSLGTFAVMTLSGYLLQISSDEQWLQALVVVHVASGGVFALTYGTHLVISARLARAREEARQESPIGELA